MTLLVSSPPVSSKRAPRRWCSFRLWHLFAAITLIGLGLAIPARKLQVVRAQRQAVEHLLARGMELQYRYVGGLDPTHLQAPFLDEEAARVFEVVVPGELDLTETDLACMAAMQGVQQIYIRRTFNRDHDRWLYSKLPSHIQAVYSFEKSPTLEPHGENPPSP